ncbi:WXG100 family type VII secretion target [Plantactinospora sp. WMMC1484]|uniref:WXG100 family type VII secretion target n=1 Tax=Plantactinospora sp. WMMC1484 TaxID=3404122 RepID=UPI003BF5E734
MAAPIDDLVEPKAADPMPDSLENILGLPQYISPSYWLGRAAELVCGTNPWQWLAGELTGDWQALQTAGAAVQNLAGFNDACASVINSAVATVGYGWEGNASDAADEYFSGISQVLRGQISALVSLGHQLETTAFSVYETAGALKGLLEGLTDLLIAIGIEMAATAASAATVIGPLLGGASIAFTAAQATARWQQILSVQNHIWNIVQAFTGVVAGLLGEVENASLPYLPSREYDHPAVRPPRETPVSHHRG